MADIVYSETGEKGLDTIGTLWRKLNEHHRERSPYFKDNFTQRTFDIRKQELLNKTTDGQLRIHLATDGDTGKIIAFCASTVSADGQGEIESIYVEQEYRRTGIGENLVRNSLKWMDTLSVKRKIVGVAFGNEEAFPFYSRFGLYPAVTILRQPDR